jgi:hypothetical protein
MTCSNGSKNQRSVFFAGEPLSRTQNDEKKKRYMDHSFLLCLWIVALFSEGIGVMLQDDESTKLMTFKG